MASLGMSIVCADRGGDGLTKSWGPPFSLEYSLRARKCAGSGPSSEAAVAVAPLGR